MTQIRVILEDAVHSSVHQGWDNENETGKTEPDTGQGNSEQR